MTTTKHPVTLPPAPEPSGIWRDQWTITGPRDGQGLAAFVDVSYDVDGLHIRTSRLQTVFIPAEICTADVCAALMAARAAYDAEGRR